MDLRNRMRRTSWMTALLIALAVSACTHPLLAAGVLFFLQLALYLLSGALVRPGKCLWPAGTRRRSDARRWMLAALCGGMAGAGALLAISVLLCGRFAIRLPALCALGAALTARSCAVAVFDRRIRRGVSALGYTATLACVLVCLYPFF